MSKTQNKTKIVQNNCKARKKTKTNRT